MIRDFDKSEYNQVYQFIRQDNARNYFIRLGLEDNRPVFEKITGQWNQTGELQAVLFKRMSGNLQFYALDSFDIDGISQYISKMEFGSLISPRSYCDKLMDRGLFSSVKDGAFIAMQDIDKARSMEEFSEVTPIDLNDLDEVVELYKRVFNSFSPRQVMEERLRSGRGRGVCIRQDGRIVSVVQSEFEEKDSAIIVGVATSPEHQGKGLATKCLKTICHRLSAEGKVLYLQYDNLDAGKIYKGLGFKPIDQVRHYKKR